MKNSYIQLSQDSPLTNLIDDRLGRTELANIIASSIINLSKSDHDCINIAIYGKWGEGKTTLMNFVESILLANGKKDSIFMTHFNPWMAGDEEKLIKDFFRSISYDVKDDIGLFFMKYGKAISFSTQHIIDVFFPHWPKVIKSPGEKAAQVVNDLKEIFTEDNVPLYIRKKELCEIIKKEHIHLLVFIDDLDRLDKNEVHAVFRLIRQVADFPNTIYMIAMDPEVVSKSLCGFYGNNVEDGRAFIDKIIQVPINLPQISTNKLTSDLDDILYPILLDEGEPENEIKDTISSIAEIITTPRQLIRFKNLISFKLNALKGEINLSDLFKLEAINIVCSAAYHKVFENRNKLFKEADLLNLTFDKENEDTAVAARFEEAIKAITDEVPANIKQSCHSIITSLFSRSGFDAFSIISQKRVQSPIFFYRYFLQGVPDDEISEKEIAEFQNDIDTKAESELTKRINVIIEKYNFDNFSRAIQVILYRNRGKDINIQRISKFCISFCQSKDCISCDEYIDDKLNYSSALAFNVINNYMRTTKDDSSFDYHPEETAALLKKIYQKSTINFSMNLLRFMYNNLNPH